MARRLPKSFATTAEEDKFFEEQKAAPTEENEEGTEQESPDESAPEEEQPEESAAESESEVESEGEPAEGRRVPIGELFAEREKRKQAQDEAKALGAKITQLEATFQKVLDRQGLVAQPQQAPAEPPIPAYETDPVGHLKAQIDRLTQGQQYTAQRFQQQSAMEQFSTALGGLENQMRATTPDYDAAVDFAKRSRLADLQALGFSDPAQQLEMLRQEILNTAAYALQNGQNPAHLFYEFAKTRGWNGKGERPTASAVRPADKLAAVAKGQSAGRSLPKGGSPVPASITLESLAEMDDSDFDKNFERFWKRT